MQWIFEIISKLLHILKGVQVIWNRSHLSQTALKIISANVHIVAGNSSCKFFHYGWGLEQLTQARGMMLSPKFSYAGRYYFIAFGMLAWRICFLSSCPSSCSLRLDCSCNAWRSVVLQKQARLFKRHSEFRLTWSSSSFSLSFWILAISMACHAEVGGNMDMWATHHHIAGLKLIASRRSLLQSLFLCRPVCVECVCVCVKLCVRVCASSKVFISANSSVAVFWAASRWRRMQINKLCVCVCACASRAFLFSDNSFSAFSWATSRRFQNAQRNYVCVYVPRKHSSSQKPPALRWSRRQTRKKTHEHSRSQAFSLRLSIFRPPPPTVQQQHTVKSSPNHNCILLLLPPCIPLRGRLLPRIG